MSQSDSHIWNHRVVRHPAPVEGAPDLYTIHEVFYGPGRKTWEADPQGTVPRGESLEELRETLERMLRALDQPVLLIEDMSEVF